MTTDYRPIDCDQHGVLELLAMRRSQVVVTVSDPGGVSGAVRVLGRVVDVYSRAGAEYLVVETAPGQRERLRLDRLLRIDDATGQVFAAGKSSPRD